MEEKNNYNNLFIMCGLQASGKSTFAKELKEKIINSGKQCELLSSDEYRFTHKNWNNEKVFSTLHSDMNESLKVGDCIVDATNITIKTRAQLLSAVKEKCKKICYIMNTPFEDCLKRLLDRNNSEYIGKISPEVLKKYYYTFEIPFFEEGWDEILLVNNFDLKNETEILEYKQNLIKKMEGYKQQCRWHKETLDEHNTLIKEFLQEKSKTQNVPSILFEVAQLHDIGKLKAQKLKLHHNETGLEMCYHNHENMGAYDLLCMPNMFTDRLNVLFYINYHMKGFDIKSDEKIYEKYLNIFGKEKVDNLLLFCQADSASSIFDRSYLVEIL